MKIVAIIPAFNEGKSIGKVIKGLKRHVNEIIVIDDGSTDNTVKVAKRLGARVYSHQMNRGLSQSILDGYTEALRRKADIILQIDADGQYLPKESPKLLRPILKDEADMVLGSRFSGTIEEMPIRKRIGNKIFSLITNLLSGVKITDAQTGFRAMRREVLENIIPTGKYTYTQEMIIRTSKEKYRILEKPVYFAKRKHGKSRLISNIFSYANNCLMIMLKTFREYHPLTFFGGPGIIIFIFGFAYGVYLVNIYITTGRIAHMIGSVVLSSFAMISGLFLIFLGMLADMMQSKYYQIREHVKRISK